MVSLNSHDRQLPDSVSDAFEHLATFDLDHIAGSQLVGVAREAFRLGDVDFLCFGESDHPSPVCAQTALKQALDAGHTRYPDIRGVPALRQGLADYLSELHQMPVSEDRIAVTASGMAAINVAFAALLREGDTAVLISPAWPNPGNLAALKGVKVRDVPLLLDQQGFTLNLEALEAALPGSRVLFLNSPNNPTGWTASAQQMQAILDLCRRYGVWIVSDEVYSRLIYDGRQAAPSMLDIATAQDRLVVCNSFSKAWAMTGYRVGWLVAPQGQREKLGELIELTHSGVAPFVQMAALAALQDRPFVDGFRDYCVTGRAIVSAALAGVAGIRYHQPDAALYAFIQLEGVSDSLSLAMALVQQHGVAIAPGSAFGPAGEGFIRVCFAQKPELLRHAMERLARGLQTELAKQGPVPSLVAANPRSVACLT
ncbi:pyridoxal phosphate-dependent aminotransferase [Pseudomonas sp. B21-028]|uniref:pyridoxal phosphate-dependent aminotransferase n=1 Tax=Pseudomonas sp. B21-028 TaxID=2895480 RepID=UPI00215EBBA1|nr:pyridoxal phosphate-dependent aminotransferase [Pseudomonas sp. B21-028]UVL83124.1 pyridoxal phosphate-dependent aminotransferase [Pseudomonas sp. B21-028]